ncbi:MAG: hypothetical protein U0457_09170 [Candidatus Sericytochromatia bacterium]
MKNNFILFVLFVLFSCNNTNSQAPTPNTSNSPTPVNSNQPSKDLNSLTFTNREDYILAYECAIKNTKSEGHKKTY